MISDLIKIYYIKHQLVKDNNAFYHNNSIDDLFYNQLSLSPLNKNILIYKLGLMLNRLVFTISYNYLIHFPREDHFLTFICNSIFYTI